MRIVFCSSSLGFRIHLTCIIGESEFVPGQVLVLRYQHVFRCASCLLSTKWITIKFPSVLELLSESKLVPDMDWFGPRKNIWSYNHWPYS